MSLSGTFAFHITGIGSIACCMHVEMAVSGQEGSMTPREQAEQNPIFRCITGSRAYGTSTPTSDLDVRGVFAATPISLMTPFFPVDQVEGPGDTVLFELSKYVGLVCAQNPNIVELLWVEPSDVLFASPAWQILHDRREQLLTTKVRTTYGGFATQALKGMRGHEKWLNNPQPEEPPRPCDFMLMVHNFTLERASNTRVPTEGEWTAVGIGQDLYLLHEGGSGSWHDARGNLRTFTRELAAEALQKSAPAALIRFDRKEYELRKRDHDNYWTWKRNRNKHRGALEEKMGFDAKNGAHLIRLLRTAHEILTEGVVRVRRPDSAELLSIRSGEVPYERVVEMADEIESGLAEDERTSSLPKTVDQAMVGAVVMEMYERTWSASRMRTQVAAPAASMGHAGAPDVRGRVVVFDLEMTGFSHEGKSQIVEIGAVELMGGRQTGKTFHAYVNPQAKLNHFGIKVHGLTKRFLADKPTFAEVAPGFLDFVGNAPLMAHNARTDMMSLNNDLRLAGLSPMEPGRAACTARLAAALLGVDNMGLNGLCDAFGVDRTPRARGHAAMLDASLLAQCVLQMAQMPGYGGADRVWVRSQTLTTRAQRRTAKAQAAGAVGCTDVEFSDDLLHATFSFSDGRTATMAVPLHPTDTHTVVKGRGNTAMVVRIHDLEAMREGRGTCRPDNPQGDALLVAKDGRVFGVDVRRHAGRPPVQPDPPREHEGLSDEQAPPAP
jgi:DNA polymerase III epsilon subunit